MSAPVTLEQEAWQQTLDLSDLAQIHRGDRVEVEALADRTEALFSRTIKVLQDGGPQEPEPGYERLDTEDGRYIPENEDLRKVYLFAEALGGYEALNDLSSKHSPGRALSRKFGRKAQTAALSDDEVRIVQGYHRQLCEALENANRYLLENELQAFSHGELYELCEILNAARTRSQELSETLGVHLIHEIERSIQRLHEIREKVRSVERTVGGIFLIESEVMFIPTYELIECVDHIFSAVGNPYVANNIDGVLLLAGRNLLIDVISFHSYYGKQQIYNLFARDGVAVNPRLITLRIRHEIRKLFKAVTTENKLVLTRVMKGVHREFELSVEAIQEEAAQKAYEQVKIFLPREDVKKTEAKRSWLGRILRWFSG